MLDSTLEVSNDPPSCRLHQAANLIGHMHWAYSGPPKRRMSAKCRATIEALTEKYVAANDPPPSEWRRLGTAARHAQGQAHSRGGARSADVLADDRQRRRV